MFKRRSEQAELLDEPGLPDAALRRNLDELAFINKWLGGNAVVTNALDQLSCQAVFKPFSGKTLQIADVGSGGGDVLLQVARWARKKQIQARLTGIDANAFMVQYAAQKCRQHPNIRFLQHDIFSPEFTRQKYDIFICSLFCHHFTNEQLLQLFRQLAQQAQLAVIINDLHRHPLAYYSIKWLSAAFSKSYLVKHDAPLSVLRAFREQELKQLLQEAGLRHYSLRWMWAFRWQLIIYKQ